MRHFINHINGSLYSARFIRHGTAMSFIILLAKDKEFRHSVTNKVSVTPVLNKLNSSHTNNYV
jgi:hypothetical protein